MNAEATMRGKLHGMRQRRLAAAAGVCIICDVRLDEICGKLGAASLLRLELPRQRRVAELVVFVLDELQELRANVLRHKVR